MKGNDRMRLYGEKVPPQRSKIAEMLTAMFVVCVMFLVGCASSGLERQGEGQDMASSSDSAYSQIALSYEEGALPTENQLEVAERIGMEEPMREQAASEGFERTAYYLVAAAEAAEIHLAEKYGQAFAADYADVATAPTGHSVRVGVTCQDGPYAGQSATCYVEWEADGQPVDVKENYFAIARDEEYAGYVERRLGTVLSSCGEDVVLSAALSPFLSVGDDFDASTPIERVVAECAGGIDVVFAPSDGMTEERYHEVLETILQAAAEMNPQMWFSSAYLTELYTLPDGTPLELEPITIESYLNTTDADVLKLGIWRLDGTVGDGVFGSAEDPS